MVNQLSEKLIFVINTLHGGGAERVICNLANYHHQKGHEVQLVCLNPAEPAYPLAAGIVVTNLIKSTRKRGLLYRFWYSMQVFAKLSYLLQREKPFCVVSFMTSANLWTALTCSILNFPYIVSERITPALTINKFNPLMRRLTYLLYKNAKAVVLPSKSMQDGFRKSKTFQQLRNIEIINNPITLFPDPQISPVYPHRFILAVGRLSTQKGFDLLITAFRRLEEKSLHLLISGEGEQREALEAQIEQLGLAQRIKLIGFRENIQDYYSQADLFVLSSRNEGYPNALLEALSLGSPCIATNCEYGPSDLIDHGKNGILVKSENIYQLASAMAMVLKDPLLKAKISVNAKSIRHSHSITNTSEKWTELFQQINGFNA
ncbi:glycosyltransferase family 4 protein [Pedobacter polysacchareus]|uniref:glycosyltransferase family 4 protein n=1 Tax=Pedobacter polysacchareus TaxID=2861973 RepID=UPI001C99D4F8|nr:glycosyltransferase family 4 protein [Pedobacter polysacchareus]